MNHKEDPLFTEIVGIVINIEGKPSNDPRDPGGPTKFGVAWNKQHHNITRMFGYKTWQEFMEKFTKDEAIELYYECFYVASGGAGLTDEGLAFVHFDCAVNQGVGRAKAILASLSKNPRHYDGRGSRNYWLFFSLCTEYLFKRLDAYTDLKSSLRREYMSGWVNRVLEIYHKMGKLDPPPAS